MLNFQIKFFLSLAFFLAFNSQANAITKCTAPDGSISYVQGNCPSPAQGREEVRVWDSGKGMKIGPNQTRPLNPPAHSISGDQAINVEPRRPRNSRHPCNSTSTNPVQSRLATQACAVLNGPHDPDNQACRLLASGDWEFSIEKMTVPRYRQLTERCRATSGNRATSDNMGYGGKRAQGCEEMTIVKPTPFLGNRDEIFQLSDRSVWEVTDGYRHLHEFRPDVVICPAKEVMIVDDDVVSVRRID